MAWEEIERTTAVPKPKVPGHGVAVSTRKAPKGVGPGYIAIKVGDDLARSAKFGPSPQRVRLMFGTGTDAGKIAVSVDDATGRFVAKRNKRGGGLAADHRRSRCGWPVRNVLSTVRRNPLRGGASGERLAAALRLQGVRRDACGR
ncbi:MAG: hypothetical protein JO290_12915 [Sphingomonadaceae bacterium]|nr:hypothetical protein [Sphingomonadaceae bacterium]